MNLARSTYYYRLKNAQKALERERKDADRKELIDQVHLEFPYYGYRMLQKELRKRGYIINHKTIRRLQQKFGLFPVSFRKFVRTTDSRHSLKVYPNLLRGILFQVMSMRFGFQT